MITKLIPNIVFIFLSASFSFAQINISGFVKNKKGKPIKNVNISIKGSYDGGLSDSLGYYSFDTYEEGIQIISFETSGFTTWEEEIIIEKQAIKLNMILRESINELAAVTISAGSFEASDAKRSSVLKPLDIVTTAGANADISATLQTLPGAQRVGESEGLFIRGGSAEESKIIIDGTVVNKFFFSSVPGIAQRGRFSPFLFNNTAFSSGGYSALYGQALSAVLNLESVDLPQRSEMQAGISPIFSNVGFQKVNEKKTKSYGMSYSYSNLWLYMKLIKQQQEFYLPPTAHNFDANYRVKLKKGIIKTYMYCNTSDLGLRSSSLDSIGLKNNFRLSNLNVFGNISYKQLLKNNWKWYSVASYSFNDDNIKSELQNQANEYAGLTYISVLDGVNFNLRSKEEMAQIRTLLEKKFGKLSAIRFGTELWHNSLISNFEFQKIFPLNISIKELYQAGFVESDIYVSNRFAFRPGLRVEYTDLIGKFNIAPRLSASFQLAQPTQISFDYGIFYQTPDRKYYYQQNIPVKSEYMRADHYILTFQHLTPEYTFRTQVFRKDYQNLVKTGINSQEIENFDGTGYAQGVELFWRDKKTFKGLDYWVSYSFLDTKRDYLNFPILTAPTYAASHTGSLVIKKFWVSKMMGVNYSFNWASGRPYYNPNRTDEYFLTDRTPFFSVHNVSYNYITKIKKANAVFVVGINNIFNQKQIFNYAYSNRIFDEQGLLTRYDTSPPAKMSFFVGLFMSWGVDRTQESINNNL